MTSPVPTAETPSDPDPPRGGPESMVHSWAGHDPGERGRLQISPTVVARIAEAAAREVPDILSVSRSVFGVSVGARQAARVRASVNASRAQLQVNLAIRYPADVAAVAEQVRRAVAARVGELAGMAVLEVVISVDRLTTPPPPPRVL